MTIFKTILKIVKTHIAAFIIYLALPIVMTMFYVTIGGSQAVQYETSQIKFAVFDHDQSIVSTALVDFLEQRNVRVELAKDQDQIRDNLFYNQVSYVIEIPEGFGDELISATGTPVLGRQIAPDTAAPQAFDQRIERFISMAERYLELEPDASIESIMQKTTETALATGTVTLDDVGQDKGTEALPILFRFFAYTILNLALLIIAQTLMSFRKRSILERNLVSATSPTTLNRRLLGSVLVICFAAFILNVLPVFIIIGSTIFQTTGLLLLMNLFFFSIVAISIGFLTSTIFKPNSGLSSGLQVVVPLVMCFFSGIFVPLEFIPEHIRQIGSFMPTYWYNQAVIAIESEVRITPELVNKFLQYGAIQLAFAAVFFIAYFVIEYRRQKSRKIVAFEKI